MPKSEKFILFYLGEEQYALPAISGNKFIEFKNLSSLPNIQKEIKGLLYHNGNIVTVVDIKSILKIKSFKKNSQKMCLLFEMNNYYYGILVDQGGDTVAAKRIYTDAQKKIFKKYFKNDNKDKIYILDPVQILNQINIL